MSLPIIGAIVLVRLLDNTTVCFSMSNHILLGLRDGRPTVSVRTISSTGHLYTNRHVRAFFAMKSHDAVTGENYGQIASIEFPAMDLVHVRITTTI